MVYLFYNLSFFDYYGTILDIFFKEGFGTENMDRNKRKNLLIYSLTALVLVASLFSITQVYILSRNKIKEQMLKTSEKEIEIIVGQIKNTLHYEIEEFVDMLELIKENINLDFNSLEKTKELLGKVREKGAFSDLGIMDLIQMVIK